MKRNCNTTSPAHRNLIESGRTRKGGAHSMDIIIYTDGVELTDKLRESVHLKIGRVRQYAPGAFRARVQLHKLTSKPSPGQFRAHVLYELKGNDLSAEHLAYDPIAALDIVAEKIERRLRRRKTARLARRVRIHKKTPLRLKTLNHE